MEVTLRGEASAVRGHILHLFFGLAGHLSSIDRVRIHRRRILVLRTMLVTTWGNCLIRPALLEILVVDRFNLLLSCLLRLALRDHQLHVCQFILPFFMPRSATRVWNQIHPLEVQVGKIATVLVTSSANLILYVVFRRTWWWSLIPSATPTISTLVRGPGHVLRDFSDWTGDVDSSRRRSELPVW